MLIEDECLCGAVFSVAGSFADCAAIHDRWITAHRVCREQAASDAASAAPEDQHSESEKAPTDHGIPELDELCRQYNDGEINLSTLVRRVWNKAFIEGVSEQPPDIDERE